MSSSRRPEGKLKRERVAWDGDGWDRHEKGKDGSRVCFQEISGNAICSPFLSLLNPFRPLDESKVKVRAELVGRRAESQLLQVALVPVVV